MSGQVVAKVQLPIPPGLSYGEVHGFDEGVLKIAFDPDLEFGGWFLSIAFERGEKVQLSMDTFGGLEDPSMWTLKLPSDVDVEESLFEIVDWAGRFGLNETHSLTLVLKDGSSVVLEFVEDGSVVEMKGKAREGLFERASVEDFDEEVGGEEPEKVKPAPVMRSVWSLSGSPGRYSYCQYCPYREKCLEVGRVVEPEACSEARGGYYNPYLGASEDEPDWSLF